MSNETFDRKEGEAHHLPRRAQSAEDVSVEVCQVNISRRELTAIDDSVVITGYVRFCRSWEHTYRFTWSNLNELRDSYITERLQLFEIDLSSEMSLIYLEEALESDHPLLGFVPTNKSEAVLQAITDDLRNDFANVVQSRGMRGNTGKSRLGLGLIWDTVRFTQLLSDYDDGVDRVDDGMEE